MSGSDASAREAIRRFLEIEDGVARLSSSVAVLEESTRGLRRSIAELGEQSARLPRRTLWQRLTSRWPV
jgi:phage shock protein A